MRVAVLIAALLGALALAGPAHAQQSPATVNVVTTCGTPNGSAYANNQNRAATMGTDGKLCVNATATLSGFAPNGNFATLTATGASASVALPTGAVVVFSNTGTTAVSCTLGVGAATALVSENIIQPSSWFAYTVGSNTFGACIDQTGAASNLVVLSGGTGLPTGSGGGGGGGSSSVPTSGGSTPQAGVTPVSPGYVPVQSFPYAFNPVTGKFDALNSDGFENLKVTGGVTPGINVGTGPMSSPILAAVSTPGSYRGYTSDAAQIPAMTPRGELFVASGLNPVVVAVASGVTGGTAQAATTSGVGGIPMLAATVSAGYGSGGGSVLTAGQLNIPTETTSGALRVSPVAEAVGGASSFHLNGGTANSTNSTLVSTGPHTLYSTTTLSTTTTAGFLRLYDSATAPTCSSATGAVDSFPTPAQTTTPTGYTINYGPVGVAFTNGLAFCFTGGGGDTDNTNSGNTGTFISLKYK